jgi:hypothetical protein
MAKEKSKDSKAAKPRKRTRQERRFLPQSATNHLLVYVIGGLGALGLGAGVWGYWFGHLPKPEDQGISPIFVLSVAGALLTVIAIWLGTSGDSALRVGDAGIGIEKGELSRMPWYNLSSLSWESGVASLVVSGKDEHEKSLTFKVSTRSHGPAGAWILAETTERVPKALDVPKDVIEKLLPAPASEGQLVQLPPTQVVGKRCAKSGTLIGYEPDARVCPRCERVYHKSSVPPKCKCGENLRGLRGQKPDTDTDDSPDSERDAEPASA